VWRTLQRAAPAFVPASAPERRHEWRHGTLKRAPHIGGNREHIHALFLPLEFP
jgi:hypothetical protein